MGTVWTFRTTRFCVSLEITRDRRYRYDGDDEDCEIQNALDAGEMIAFDSCVRVELDGEEIASDHLGGSVYYDGRQSEFWTAHRDADPMNRNCSLMRAKRGENACIGHYFPGMVQAAIAEAREHVRSLKPVPYIRKGV